MPEGTGYTDVELCTYGGDISRPWFVYFDFTDYSTDITIRKQFRGGINYSNDPDERLLLGNELKKFWQERLKQGWSPFLHSSVHSLSKMKFNEALDWALEKCVVASKTKADYSCCVQFFKAAAKKLKLDKARVTGINEQHILLLLDEIKESRGWTNHAYNKNAGYISAVINRLKKYKVIKYNPANGIEMLPVAETNMYETITDEEKLIIRNHLTKVHPTFFTYLMLIYHTGIRPKECLSLKISDLHLNKQLIIIKPVIVSENSKTKSIRMVPLNPHIAELLKCHVKDYGPENYVFGSIYREGGNRGSYMGGIKGAMRPDYFLPSMNHIKRDTATKLWKKLIMTDLKINKYQYALKHTGGDDKILAGIPLDALKEMYGHASKYMTEKYAKKIKNIYREQIIVNSPDF